MLSEKTKPSSDDLIPGASGHRPEAAFRAGLSDFATSTPMNIVISRNPGKTSINLPRLCQRMAKPILEGVLISRIREMAGAPPNEERKIRSVDRPILSEGNRLKAPQWPQSEVATTRHSSTLPRFHDRQKSREPRPRQRLTTTRSLN